MTSQVHNNRPGSGLSHSVLGKFFFSTHNYKIFRYNVMTTLGNKRRFFYFYNLLLVNLTNWFVYS